jgi:hypothetical protein
MLNNAVKVFSYFTSEAKGLRIKRAMIASYAKISSAWIILPVAICDVLI